MKNWRILGLLPFTKYKIILMYPQGIQESDIEADAGMSDVEALEMTPIGIDDHR